MAVMLTETPVMPAMVTPSVVSPAMMVTVAES
jgi:hypothetical protein